MSGTGPSEAEKDGLEAVRAVVDVADHKRLERSGKTGEKTGDWRVWMADGRVADVEVTTCTDDEAAGFFNALHRGGLPRVRKAKRLSHRWRVWLSDHSPRWSERHSVAELVEAICDRLEFVEAAGGTPEQMVHMAQRELIDPHAFFSGPSGRRAIWSVVRRRISLGDWLADGAPGSGYWYPPLLLDYYNGGPCPLTPAGPATQLLPGDNFLPHDGFTEAGVGPHHAIRLRVRRTWRAPFSGTMGPMDGLCSTMKSRH